MQKKLIFEPVPQHIVDYHARYNKFSSTDFFKKGSDYFLLKSGKNHYGLLAIQPLDNAQLKSCEIHIIVFLPFRHRFFTRKTLNDIKHFIQEQGYTVLIIHTALPSIKKLMLRLGMTCIFDNDKHIYLIKEFS